VQTVETVVSGVGAPVRGSSQRRSNSGKHMSGVSAIVHVQPCCPQLHLICLRAIC